jgi:hypothetical protein
MRSRIALFSLMALIWSPCFGQGSVLTLDNGNTQIVNYHAPLHGDVAVRGAPYSAELIADYKSPANRLLSRQWRDSAGRGRYESWTDGFRQDVIYDPVARVAYVIDDLTRTAHRAGLNSVGIRSDGRPAYEASLDPQPNVTVEQLGEWVIEGVVVKRTRWTSYISVPPETHETWFSLELRLHILTTYFGPRGGAQTTRLTKIKRSEPDATLFLPPEGYAVVEEVGSFAVTLKKR